mmetsp:Transcript_15039/g.24908  ORF Transcript_15039/g.24908 Transcript_15039/m.24908 type:complete len:99 (-) Transcript_15039:166-462(-)
MDPPILPSRLVVMGGEPIVRTVNIIQDADQILELVDNNGIIIAGATTPPLETGILKLARGFFAFVFEISTATGVSCSLVLLALSMAFSGFSSATKASR